MTAFRLPAALLLLATVVSGCNQAYVQDRRLSIQTPKEGQRVTAPLTVAWTMRGFDATGLDGSSSTDRGVYAIFVDTTPMPPGKDLRWVARKDSTCRHDSRCTTASYLANKGIYVTTRTSLEVVTLPLVSEHLGGLENHTLTVVLLNGQGRRIGEKAWYRNFENKATS